MGRHRKPAGPTPLPTLTTRRRLAAGLAGASALVATLLVLTVDPTAPPAPDRTTATAP
ncbi:hypothetical protein ABZT43_35565 [Streptomyces sp. NPDC005349]|uniref:hypothetical protein n=1 Tax=Streptomyces sp. NPDC005349 TaxID=3157037 RepID=UPI0033BA806F